MAAAAASDYNDTHIRVWTMMMLLLFVHITIFSLSCKNKNKVNFFPKKISSHDYIVFIFFSLTVQYNTIHQSALSTTLSCCFCYSGVGGGVSIRLIVVFFQLISLVNVVFCYCHRVCVTCCASFSLSGNYLTSKKSC